MGGEVGGGCGGEQRCVVLELPAKESSSSSSGTAGSSFDLERAVCSHGLFMMAPNCWDPLSKTLTRPLRLSSSPNISLPVRISLPPSPSPSRPLLLLSVLGPDLSLSSQDLLSISDKVRRMLRISIDNDRAIREFHDLHAGARASGFGRVFRSPSLFEDMVKCILLCNCQLSSPSSPFFFYSIIDLLPACCRWPRSLSMARALCELQLELHGSKSSEHFLPETPQSREVKRKRKTKHDPPVKETSQLPIDRIGDFPSPEELANLDADYLAKRCKLGYRAQRIVSLAKYIVEGKLEIKKLEELCDGRAPSSYDKLDEELSRLSGFGPFTRANVLMCMGFYHKIPADSETIRHLKQFHRRSCAVQSVQKDIDAIYGKYAPYQFLAYWSEVWDYYEKQFGKTSEMPPSHYQLITASNMRRKATERSR